MWGWNRPQRNVPRQNYREESSDEDPFLSPVRPQVTRAGSPQELQYPPLADNVDEELAAAAHRLNTRPLYRPDRSLVEPLGDEVDVVEGQVVGFPNQDNNAKGDSGGEGDPDIMPFDTEDGVDENRALNEALQRLERYPYNGDDLLFYFQQIEIKMAAAGVKKNFTKFQVLSSIIPINVLNEVKPLLRLTEAEFPNKDAYKQLKTEILRIFGPAPEDRIIRGLSRVMVGSPSQLARALVDDICKCTPQLNCTCCPAIISALWRRQLPESVCAGIAHLTIDHTNFKAVCELADKIFATSKPRASVAAFQVAAVRAPVAAPAEPSSLLDETQPGLSYPVPEVAAIRGRGGGRGGRGGRGFRGGRGGGRGSNNNSNASGGQSQDQQPKHKGAKHPDLPPGPWLGCSMHHRWGRSAFFCSEPATCPWKAIFTPKPAK